MTEVIFCCERSEAISCSTNASYGLALLAMADGKFLRLSICNKMRGLFQYVGIRAE